jgi:hypothetical protein
MRLAHIITRRPHLVEGAVATALRFADHVVVGLHGFATKLPTDKVTAIEGDTYLDLTNHVLEVSAELGDHTLRIDDDDYYPPDHDRILSAWEPGSTVWGLVTIKSCDGQTLRYDHADMCAGVLPTNITLEADPLGRVADSLRQQTRPITVATGVIKQVCLADQPWIHSARWQRTIRCQHAQKQPARPE